MASLRAKGGAPPATSSPTFENESFTSASPTPTVSQSPPSSTHRISPAAVPIIVVLAVVLLLSGFLHFLFRCLLSRPSSSSSPPPDPPGHQIPAVDSRQLRQLFRLHDSGVDQSLIDSLPVFSFRSVLGPRRGEAFDCAVCLSEFVDDDRLRLLPNCAHAFHLSCIETWLMANSSCPLCRGNILDAHGVMAVTYDDSVDGHGNGDSGDGHDEERVDGCHKTNDANDVVRHHGHGVGKVFSVKLGKFRNLDGHINGCDGGNVGESSGGGSANVDGRRCFSMGSFRYVVGEPSFRVKLTPVRSAQLKSSSDEVSESGGSGGVGLDLEGRRLSRRSRGDSFSVSKIWLWPRKDPVTG